MATVLIDAGQLGSKWRASLGLRPSSSFSRRDECDGVISSRTARAVLVNLVLAILCQRRVQRKAVLSAATRAQPAEADLMQHMLTLLVGCE